MGAVFSFAWVVLCIWDTYCTATAWHAEESTFWAGASAEVSKPGSLICREKKVNLQQLPSRRQRASVGPGLAKGLPWGLGCGSLAAATSVQDLGSPRQEGRPWLGQPQFDREVFWVQKSDGLLLCHAADAILLSVSLHGSLGVAGELNLLERDLDEDTKVRHTWSPGTLRYYGRAELQASDHRYAPG